MNLNQNEKQMTARKTATCKKITAPRFAPWRRPRPRLFQTMSRNKHEIIKLISLRCYGQLVYSVSYLSDLKG